MRILRLTVALSAMLLLASCVGRNQGGRQTIPYVRDILSGKEASKLEVLTSDDIPSYKDEIAIVGTDKNTVRLFESLEKYDRRDNIDGSLNPDALPDFAGEVFSLITQEEGFKSLVDRNQLPAVRRHAVMRVVAALDTLSNLSIYDLEGKGNKASSKMIVVTDPHFYHYSSFDVDTLFSATSCEVPVVYPLDVMLDKAFAENKEKLNVAILYDPDIASATIYMDLLKAKAESLGRQLGSFIVFPTDDQEDLFERLVTAFKASYGEKKIDVILVDDYDIDISEVKVRLADVVSVMNASYITYGQSFADDVKMIDVVEECASYCYDLLRSNNLFTHNISLPQAKMYRVHNTSNVLDSAIVLIPELYVQN